MNSARTGTSRRFQRSEPIAEWPSGAAFEALFLEAPVGLALLEVDTGRLHLNATLAAMLGVAAGDHLDDDPLAAELGPEATLRRRLRWVVATEQALPGERLPHRQAKAAASYFPLRDEAGEVVAAGAVIRELTAASTVEAREVWVRKREREAAHVAELAPGRLDILARAGALLGSSLDSERTLGHIADLLVPQLADWAFVALVQPDGSITRDAMAHFHQGKQALMSEFDRRYPIDPRAPEGSAKAIRTGRSELISEVPDGLLQAAAQDDEHLRLLRQVGFRSALLVPLQSAGRVFGNLTLVTAESGRRYRTDDLAIAEELADRCAQALENARLYGERSFIARALQASLLPPALPALPGIEVAARYRAAGEGTEVGGDFYDLFQLGQADWMAVIGDVTGKGPVAAGVTALARHTIRGAAARDGRPEGVLEVLNRALLGAPPERQLCTAACIRIQPGNPARLTVALGGHPVPLIVRADGSVEEAGAHGTLLGYVSDPHFPRREYRLHRGDTLVAYTDGISEAGHPRQLLGDDGLKQLLGNLSGQSADEVARGLEAAVLELDGGRPRDDVALLVLRVED